MMFVARLGILHGFASLFSPPVPQKRGVAMSEEEQRHLDAVIKMYEKEIKKLKRKLQKAGVQRK